MNQHSELTTEEISKAARYLMDARDALVASATGLSSSQWDFKPAPECWSIAEIVEHVVLVENRAQGVIGKMSDAPPPPTGWDAKQVDDFVLATIPGRLQKIQAPAPVTPTRRWSGAEALEHFIETRNHTIELLAAPALRGHVLPHPIFGPWEGYQWLLAAAGHSARHTLQIREVKARPDFPQDSATPPCAT